MMLYHSDQVMRSNPGDEYTVAEINSMEWTYSDCPKVLLDWDCTCRPAY